MVVREVVWEKESRLRVIGKPCDSGEGVVRRGLGHLNQNTLDL